MNSRALKISLVFVSLFLAINIQAQSDSNFVNLQYIFSKLDLVQNQSAKEINTKLIEEILARKIDFVLTVRDEENLRTLGANELLIATIYKNTSEKPKKDFEQKLVALINYLDNEQRIELYKQYIKYFSNIPEYETKVDYLKQAVPELEEYVSKHKIAFERELNKVLTESVVKNIESDEIKKDLAGKFIQNHLGNFKQKKIAVKAAQEFVKNFGEDVEIKDLIIYFKKRISELEKQLGFEF